MSIFEITDEGKGFDWTKLDYDHPMPYKRHGRGLLLANHLCFDQVHFIGKGNVVQCLFWIT